MYVNITVDVSRIFLSPLIFQSQCFTLDFSSTIHKCYSLTYIIQLSQSFKSLLCPLPRVKILMNLILSISKVYRSRPNDTLINLIALQCNRRHTTTQRSYKFALHERLDSPLVSLCTRVFFKCVPHFAGNKARGNKTVVYARATRLCVRVRARVCMCVGWMRVYSG